MTIERILGTDTRKAAFEKTDRNFVAHDTDIVTDGDGVHGLKIEEGTWTPIITSNAGTSAHTYLKQFGRYLKVNKKVTLKFEVSLSVKDAGMTGSVVSIGGLPFIADTDASYWNTVQIINAVLIDIASTSATLRTTGLLQLSKTAAATGAESSVPSTLITNTIKIRGELVYFTN